jgi:hypothetical protein
MTSAYSQLYFGLAGAIVLIYLVIVVNFQSWLDPFIIITALPGALAGIVWMLFMTGTTLSVPALTGAIMCMGIATANSDPAGQLRARRLAEGLDAAAAALEAGFTRFRPVLMTALAMIIGMVPMAFALGEGGEQNAPLGRAVIGGLLVATIATLFFVPTVFSVLHSPRRRSPPPTAAANLRRIGLMRRRRRGDRRRGFGILQRRSHEAEVTQWTQEQAIPTVAVITPQPAPRPTPGAARHRPGLVRGAIYARVSGYLKNWYFDYGAHVKKGDVLAEIDAPGSRCATGRGARQAQFGAQALVKVREAESSSPNDLRALARLAQGRRLGAGAGVKQADYNSARRG